MKSIGKVFLRTDGHLRAKHNSVLDGCLVASVSKRSDSDKVFLSKDDLLSWLREQVALAGVLKREAYQNVINKIESL